APRIFAAADAVDRIDVRGGIAVAVHAVVRLALYELVLLRADELHPGSGGAAAVVVLREGVRTVNARGGHRIQARLAHERALVEPVRRRAVGRVAGCRIVNLAA